MAESIEIYQETITVRGEQHHLKVVSVGEGVEQYFVCYDNEKSYEMRIDEDGDWINIKGEKSYATDYYGRMLERKFS